jgi:hypothetical protein
MKHDLKDILGTFDGSVPMGLPEVDRRRLAYKDATERWIAAIRAEEALATTDHSVVAWDHWDQAGFRAKEAAKQAAAAREAYQDGLRNIDFDMPTGGLAPVL